MRSLVTTAAATATALALFAVPSATSFTPLPSASTWTQQRARVRVHVSELDLDITTTPTTSKYDPSDAFESESSDLADLMMMDGSESESVGSIVRDLDGNPLSKEYLCEAMGIVDPSSVDSFTCPEEDAFRGFMSNACRVRLNPGGQTAFYKHIIFEQLDHAQDKQKTAPHKLSRDAKSYQVVASFLTSQACQTLCDTTGVRIPKLYDVKAEPDYKTPIDSKFSFLFQDFSPEDGWYQQWLLDDVDECKAALSTFAKVHAYFWHGSDFWTDNNADAAQELEAAIWKSGSYVSPQAQNSKEKNVNQCKMVAQEWATKRMKFKPELGGRDYWDNLGERLESVATENGRLAHPFQDDIEEELSEHYNKFRTFTHGDPKQANLLFKRGSEEELPQVGLIDFQWTGFGLAATDIAHFITSAVHADSLVDGGEDALLRYYFDELQTHLVEYGAFSTPEEALQKFTYETFMDQYEVGVMDICRLMIAYTWSRFTEPVEKDDEAGKARTMNKTSYNKSVPNVVWLMSRCDEIMKSRGV